MNHTPDPTVSEEDPATAAVRHAARRVAFHRELAVERKSAWDAFQVDSSKHEYMPAFAELEVAELQLEVARRRWIRAHG